jgi:hypothetical protein
MSTRNISWGVNVGQGSTILNNLCVNIGVRSSVTCQLSLSGDRWYRSAIRTVRSQDVDRSLEVHVGLLLLLLLIAFMQGIYNYIPETNHVCTVHSVAANL